MDSSSRLVVEVGVWQTCRRRGLLGDVATFCRSATTVADRINAGLWCVMRIRAARNLNIKRLAIRPYPRLPCQSVEFKDNCDSLRERNTGPEQTLG